MNGQQAQGPDNREQTVLSEVLQAIRRMGHGYVQVIVRDDKAIRIDTWRRSDLIARGSRQGLRAQADRKTRGLSPKTNGLSIQPGCSCGCPHLAGAL